MSIETLFDPGTIAVVGASRTEGKIGNEVMGNVAAFDGAVHPVNPNGEGTLMGREFVGSVAEIDGRVDLALLCVPAPVVPDVLAECGEAGVGAAVVYAGGFAEAGEEGRERQRELAGIADEHGIRLLGPNTSGFLVPGAGLYTSFVGGVQQVDPGNVAIVAQSGGVAHALAFQAASAGRGVSAMVGLGNRANTGFGPVVEYFDAHADTGAIVLHVEGTDDARGLLETCRDAATPVVAYKVGREDVGAFAESHTGTLTGDHALYRAGFRQYGVPTVESSTELLDAGHALASAPEPGGTNVGVVTAQAGPGIIIADRLKAAGATLPELGEEAAETVTEHLPGITYAENPVDTGRPMPEFGEVIEAVARDDGVDVVLVYEVYEEALGYPVDDLDGLAEAVGKPILFATDGPPGDLREDVDALEAAGVPTFETPERGADAASALVEYARLRAERADAAAERADEGDGGNDDGGPREVSPDE